MGSLRRTCKNHACLRQGLVHHRYIVRLRPQPGRRGPAAGRKRGRNGPRPAKLGWVGGAGADRVEAVRLDVLQPAQVQPAIDAALERFGRLDVVVNNAGFSMVGAVEETGEADLRQTFETMFFGAAAVTRAVPAAAPAARLRHDRPDHQRRRSDHHSRFWPVLCRQARLGSAVGIARGRSHPVWNPRPDRRTRRLPHASLQFRLPLDAGDGDLCRHRRAHAGLCRRLGGLAAR